MLKNVSALILVAGNSTRFAQNFNKNFAIVNEKPILYYSLSIFNNNELINDIVVVIREKDEEIVKNIIDSIDLKKRVQIVYGGRTRQESVYNGLSMCHNTDIVLIHDGARPCIKDEYIYECITNMESYKGVSLGVRSKDTIKITDDEGIVLSSTIRDNTWVIQTPQCFDYNILKELHEKYKGDINTDDCMLLEKEGIAVKIIDGDYTNIKVTTYSDLSIIKEYLDK